ncbi:MAG: 50S ribosomal protein L15 [Actinomycetota bacterium]|nr:50S ribosomal protein L15 [Actinomycetota bacterium]
MKPHDLKPPPGSRKAAKRVGRGEGSGHGKTAGRGSKGTRARGSVPAGFEGGQMPLLRRVPKLKGFRPPNRNVYGVVNLDALDALPGPVLGPDEIRAAGLLHKRNSLIKVLGRGEITGAKTVRAHAFSLSARAKIESAGGSAELISTAPAGTKAAR